MGKIWGDHLVQFEHNLLKTKTKKKTSFRKITKIQSKIKKKILSYKMREHVPYSVLISHQLGEMPQFWWLRWYWKMKAKSGLGCWCYSHLRKAIISVLCSGQSNIALSLAYQNLRKVKWINTWAVYILYMIKSIGNGYSDMSLIAFQKALILLGKVWIQLFSL